MHLVKAIVIIRLDIFFIKLMLRSFVIKFNIKRKKNEMTHLSDILQL